MNKHRGKSFYTQNLFISKKIPLNFFYSTKLEPQTKSNSEQPNPTNPNPRRQFRTKSRFSIQLHKKAKKKRTDLTSNLHFRTAKSLYKKNQIAKKNKMEIQTQTLDEQSNQQGKRSDLYQNLNQDLLMEEELPGKDRIVILGNVEGRSREAAQTRGEGIDRRL